MAVGRLRPVKGEIDARREQVSRRAGGHEFAQPVDDVRDAVGNAQESLVAQRIGQGVDEPGAGSGQRRLLKGRVGLAGVAFEEVSFVVLEVDENARRGGDGALIGEDEFAHALPWSPGVDEIGGAGVGEESRLAECFFIRGRHKQRVAQVSDGVLARRNHHDAGMAGRAKRVGEAPDVVQAVGGKIAVVDEEDVHAGSKKRKIKANSRSVGKR